jgi:hypothetical protein
VIDEAGGVVGPAGGFTMASHRTIANKRPPITTNAKSAATMRDRPARERRGAAAGALGSRLAGVIGAVAPWAAPQRRQNRAPGDSSAPHCTHVGRVGEDAGGVGSEPREAPQCRQKRAFAAIAPPHEEHRVPGSLNRSSTCPPPPTPDTQQRVTLPNIHNTRFTAPDRTEPLVKQVGPLRIIANPRCPVKAP